MILVLSHSHGANITKQASRKRPTAGMTKAAVIRTLSCRQSRLANRHRYLQKYHHFPSNIGRCKSILQKVRNSNARTQSGRTPKLPNQNSKKPSSSCSQPARKWMTCAIDPLPENKPVTSAKKIVAGRKEDAKSLAT